MLPDCVGSLPGCVWAGVSPGAELAAERRWCNTTFHGERGGFCCAVAFWRFFIFATEEAS